MSEPNPFNALLKEGENSISENRKKNLNKEPPISLLEKIFAFSLDKETAEKNGYKYLGEIFTSPEIKLELNLENLSYCLCERLLSFSSDSNHSTDDTLLNHANEGQAIKYLYACYKAYIDEGLDSTESFHIIKEEILRDAATAFVFPDIYSQHNLERQLIEIMMDNDFYTNFFSDLCNSIEAMAEEAPNSLKLALERIVTFLTAEIQQQTLSTYDIRYFNVLKSLTMQEKTAVIFMECNNYYITTHGLSFGNTLLGALFNIGILPKADDAQFEYFQNMMSRSAVDAEEGIVWSRIKLITEELRLFILNLLKISPTVNHLVLEFFGLCVAKNSDREKLWNTQMSLDLSTPTCVPDGFMLQMGSVLLRLSEPFCNKKKILKVDPTYCAVTNDLRGEKNVHLYDMSGQTCLLPQEDTSVQRPTANSYSFITECFYLTHMVIHLGFAVAVEKIVKMNQEFARLESILEASRNGSIGHSDRLGERLKSSMKKLLCYKAQLTEPNMLVSLYNFMSYTCYWLCQVAVKQGSVDGIGYAPNEESEISFPITSDVPETMKSIPEFIINNIICFVTTIKRFSVGVFEEQELEKLEPILTFILMFMGNHGYMKNPHLRAELAESLYSLLPLNEGEMMTHKVYDNFQRKKLFSEYCFKKQVVKSLLEVFVGIEMTGQSVEFEQKFNYRRPMYKIMEYLWETEEYQDYFRKLAEEAEENMEAVLPPIFLRFINLLINDAVFLLDESLTNMASLRELQTRRDEAGSTPSTPESVQVLASIRQIGMIARFDNILGKDTITALENLTSKITIVFTHSTMVDRMASMLNYFLYNLVGPNKKNFKVKNPKDYNFEPAETVLKICKIYINLKDSDAFCLAISQDGRSYSPQLFSLAEDVLIRIGGGSYILEIKELAEKVSRKAEEYQASEETTVGAPDHFLDPIMSTLMVDPVILPSSKKVVDRTTIARHLLSDQTDPFNRSPLSMDQVIPDTKLADEIKQWVAERQSTRR